MSKKLVLCMTAAALLAAGFAHAADRVKVGLVTTLSGPAGAPGVDVRDGFNLALKHLGGIGREVIVKGETDERGDSGKIGGFPRRVGGVRLVGRAQVAVGCADDIGDLLPASLIHRPVRG